MIMSTFFSSFKNLAIFAAVLIGLRNSTGFDAGATSFASSPTNPNNPILSPFFSIRVYACIVLSL